MLQIHTAPAIRGALVAALGAGDTTLDVEASAGIWQAPPAPAQGFQGVVTLIDDLQSPGALELVWYTGRSDLGGGQYRLAGLTRGAEGTTAQAWAIGAHVLGAVSAAALGAAGAPANLLINGDGQVDQIGAAAGVADASYGPDQWLVLMDGTGYARGNADATDYPPGGVGSIKLTVSGTGGRCALLQPLEASVCGALVGGEASLQLRAKGTGIAALRVALLAWTGTADAITRDAIATWGAVGANPSLAANWVYCAAATPWAIGSAWGVPLRLEALPVTAAGAKQVAVLIVVDETVASGDVLRLAGMRLEPGPRATPHWPTDPGLSLRQAQRYLQNGYALDWHMANASQVTGMATRFGLAMRAPPSVTWSSTATGAANTIRNLSAAVDLSVTASVAASRVYTGYPLLGSFPSVISLVDGNWRAAAQL